MDGTPNWMAPEVIELRGASCSSDIWSLGCTIVELIDGKPPYSNLNTMSAMFRIVEDELPPIPDRCSPELVDFLKLCFAKDPTDRPTALELLSHKWLEINWNPNLVRINHSQYTCSTTDCSSPLQDLRPQDSLPFLRRLSTETSRPSLNSARPNIDDILASEAFPTPHGSPRRFAFADAQPRNSTDSAVRFDLPTDAPREHAFVKTSFSKGELHILCKWYIH